MRKIIAILICFAVMPARAASIIQDTEIESVITEIIKPVTTAANIPDAQIRIVNDDNFNAFVMGGTDIYIYTGLLTRIRTPNALRAVIAHELGHTIGGHMAQMSARMESEIKRTMMIQALGIGLMLAGGNPSLGAGVMAGASGIARQSMLAFSRDEERVADDMGFDLMVRAGYNPNGFVDVFEQMRDMTSHIESRINPNAINHPLTAERLKNVRDKLASPDIKSKNFKTDSPAIGKKYDMVRAKLVGYLDDATRVKTLYPSADKTDAAIYARAIANMRWGNLSGAAVGTRTLVSRNPNNPYFYELLGDLEYRYGHYDDAITAYERALKLRPNSPQIETALALVLVERAKNDDVERAAELCRRVILTDPSPVAYWVLARTFDADDGRGDWAMAEFYRLQNNREKSREYARRAKGRLKPGTPEYIKSNDILNSAK
ncbi:MAG: M48 family metalloprotease [Alphaproteobacteria bacterium]|nr:M48 family metalloprotease [Alphaproteobacteria bacterium]